MMSRWILRSALLAVSTLVLRVEPTAGQGLPKYVPGLRYEDPIDTAQGGDRAVRSLHVVDLNQDGFLDVIQVVSGDTSTYSTISIWFGDGLGGLVLDHTYPIGESPQIPFVIFGDSVTADFDGNGTPDLAAINTCCTYSGAFVRFFDSAGHMDYLHTAFIPLAVPRSIAAGDLDHDGFADLLVGTLTGELWVLLNDHGNFVAHINLSFGGQILSIAVGDLDHDGKLDVVCANGSHNALSILKGDGLGNLTLTATLTTLATPSAVRIADVDHDDRADLIVADAGAGSVEVFRGDGSGGFSPSSVATVGVLPIALASGDFDGNGTLDIAVANALDGTISILPGDGSGSFPAQRDFLCGPSPGCMAAGDLDGDGRLDLIVGDRSHVALSVVLGDGRGRFGMTHVPSGSNLRALALADLNKDGKLDAAVVRGSDQALLLLLGDGTGELAVSSVTSTGASPNAVVLADFDSDGNLDAAVADSGADTITLAFGDGQGGIASTSTLTVGAMPLSVIAADFDHDGHVDLAVLMNGNPGSIGIWLGDGAGGFQAHQSWVSDGQKMVAADLDNDGDLDLLPYRSDAGTIHTYLNDGQGTFVLGPGSIIQFEYSLVDLAIGDLDGDGIPDLVMTSGLPGNQGVYWKRGHGIAQFGPVTPLTSDYLYPPSIIALHDLDGDGKLEILTSEDSFGSRTILWRSSWAPLATPFSKMRFGAAGFPTAFAFGDLDGDGADDIVVIGSGTDGLAVEINRHQHTVGSTFCSGDGLDPLVTTDCPCNNFGSLGHGCMNSIYLAGGLLRASGSTLVNQATATDSLVLTASSVVSTVVFLQGDGHVPGGVVFGDGVRCAGGHLIRIGVKASTNGTAIFPETGDQSISHRGHVQSGAGLTRFYQAYYRNPDPSFCPTATFNITNGLALVW